MTASRRKGRKSARVMYSTLKIHAAYSTPTFKDLVQREREREQEGGHGVAGSLDGLVPPH